MRRTVADYFELLRRRDRIRNWAVARAIAAVRYGNAEKAPDDEVRALVERLPSIMSADEARRRIALTGARVDPIHRIAWEEAATRVMVVHRENRLRALGVLIGPRRGRGCRGMPLHRRGRTDRRTGGRGGAGALGSVAR